MFVPKSKLTPATLIFFLTTTWTATSIAECPCQRSGGSFPAGNSSPIPMSASYDPAMGQYSPYSSPQFQYGAPVYGSEYQNSHYGTAQAPMQYGVPGMPMVTGSPTNMEVSPYQSQLVPGRPNPEPPPGTIGKSFKLPSRPVPVEKHPRVGMIDVKVVDASEVIVHDMNAMRTEETIDGFQDAKIPNVWHFESKPLYPGLDHIYRVQATFKNDDGTERKQERYVRLIMGRVVELNFAPESYPQVPVR